MIVWFIAACALALVASARADAWYFWNVVTDEVTWEDPGDVPFFDETSGERFYVDANGDSTWDQPTRPHGWTEHYDDEENAPFFHNALTNEVTWDRPKELGWRRVKAEDDRGEL